MRKAFICLLLVAFSSLHLIAQTIPNNNPLRTKTDKLVHQNVIKLMTENPKVGLSIGVYDNGKISLYHYGTVEKDKVKLPNDRTIYEIASITKTFTGALLAKAISEKKISLVDDIREYLNEPYPNLEFEGKFISIRDLASHQSGLPRNIPYDARMWENPNFDTLPYQINQLEAGYTVKDWLRELHNIKLTRAPGSIEFEYSNFGINLIAIALENIYGRSYEQMVAESIFKPLKMSDTTFRIAEVKKANLAKGYNHKGKEMPYFLDNVRAAGGIKSSLRDMMSYVAFQMNEAQTIPRISHQSIWTNRDKTFSVGLGWQMFSSKKGSRNVFEDGGAYGFSSTITLFPDKNLGFVLLSNESGPNSQAQLREVAENIVENLSNELDSRRSSSGIN
jgi:CubicO group peptidase (beta-lactamase class C family)